MYPSEVTENQGEILALRHGEGLNDAAAVL